MSIDRDGGRVIRYREIAEHLRDAIRSGRYEPGSVLPSENDLSGTYRASRVTVRRALEALRSEGLVESRQGYGWIVVAEPLPQELSRLGTIEARLAAAGVRSDRRVLRFGFVDAPRRVADILGVRTVLEVRRSHLADGLPFALVDVWCPEALGAGLSRADVERRSFLAQLPVAIGGATQSISAAAVDRAEADLLEVPAGSPVLVAERITRDRAGSPVLFSRQLFPAHRTSFVVELDTGDDAVLASGLRLVDAG